MNKTVKFLTDRAKEKTIKVGYTNTIGKMKEQDQIKYCQSQTGEEQVGKKQRVCIKCQRWQYKNEECKIFEAKDSDPKQPAP